MRDEFASYIRRKCTIATREGEMIDSPAIFQNFRMFQLEGELCTFRVECILEIRRAVYSCSCGPQNALYIIYRLVLIHVTYVSLQGFQSSGLTKTIPGSGDVFLYGLVSLPITIIFLYVDSFVDVCECKYFDVFKLAAI